MALSASKILKKIKVKDGIKFELVRGEGYWYFVYDNGDDIYETHSVYCMYLSQMSDIKWIDEGRSFVKKMESR